MGTKVLVTGASGFLGRIITDVLTQEGQSIVGLDILGQELNIDITKSFSLNSDLDLDIVVHAAGKAHSVPRNEAQKKEFYDVNFEGTKNLCLALEHLAAMPKSFLFISTVAVYGLDSGEMIPEDHPLNGKTPYAKSKILAEQWLKDWAERNHVILGVLRLPLIAGPNPPGNLGAMIRGIRTGRYLSIGKADARKSVVWQYDIPHIMPVLANIGGTYNLTDGYNPSFAELEAAIATALKRKLPIKIPLFIAKILGLVGDLLGDLSPINTDKINKITSTLTFDDVKARTSLEWKPSSVLERLTKTL